MGNSGSQNALTENILPEEQWNHSFLRSTYHSNTKLHFQHKVLPERNAHLKLKSTNNGEIIQAGGSISKRHRLTLHERNKKYLENSNSSDHRDFDKDLSRKSAIYGVQHKLSNISSQQIKPFASEPDLRYTHFNQDSREKKSKKKYKAPSPPVQITTKLSKEDNLLNFKLPIRKARLFKTRAESKKQSSQTNEIVEEAIANSNESNAKDSKLYNPKRLSLPEVKLIDSEKFFKELKDATKRIRSTTDIDIKKEDHKTKLKTLDHNLVENHDMKQKIKEELRSQPYNFMKHCTRGEASGKESTTPEMSPSPKSRHDNVIEPLQPKEHFYFGMNKNESNTVLNTKSDVQHSSVSDISSDIDSDENEAFKAGIDLQLRPILPKKQLEIPRFSPAAAWRLLSLDTKEEKSTAKLPNGCGGTVTSEDVPLLMEEHIQKYSRPFPPLINAGQRSNNDKSGDSGISGDDAIPIIYSYDEEDTVAKINIREKNTRPSSKPERISWTPQQDLGDDSSGDDDINDKISKQKGRPHVGPHVFSLSLPRDNLAAYMTERINGGNYNGLQRFKKSISGVWGNATSQKDSWESNFLEKGTNNWFLSKSAPNSLTNVIHSLERHKTPEEYTNQHLNHRAATRLIYLPEINNNTLCNVKTDENNYRVSQKSSSCENGERDMQKKFPEQLQDPISNDSSSWNIKRKPKKYTFQSTIRQIEKKRLSDKLSREAEKREKERLRELKAMQKVEEEFQKKRAREKADIRNQLRLFSMEDVTEYQSLPTEFEIQNKDRSEPDGAFSSVSSSSSSSPILVKNGEKLSTPSTKELSEYRQMERDYKDYNSNMLKHPNPKRGATNRHTTIYPQVRCQMNRVKGGRTQDNYRKDFASGARNLFSSDGNHSEDSQNYRKRTMMLI